MGMRAAWVVVLGLVAGCGKPAQVEHVVKVEMPQFGAAKDEPDTANSKTLYKSELVRLSVERTDAGAYLSLKGFAFSLSLTGQEAESIAAELAKFDDFYQREHNSKADIKEEHNISGYQIQFSKDAKTGFMALVAGTESIGGVAINREDVKAILPHLLNASEIIERSGASIK